jgi:hypothetical protein
MAEFPLLWLPEAIRDYGVEVVTVRNWRTRGGEGTFRPIGMCDHHTASHRTSGSFPSAGIVTFGRSDIPGPLCHILGGRNAKVMIIAAGRANHAGFGGPWRTVPQDSGNSYLVGFEIEHDGIGERYTDEQLEMIFRVNAAVLDGLGKRDKSWLLFHKTWAPTRKIDPDSGVTLRAWRRGTRAALIGKEDPFMALRFRDMGQFKEAVREAMVGQDRKGEPQMSPSEIRRALEFSVGQDIALAGGVRPSGGAMQRGFDFVKRLLPEEAHEGP